MLRVCCVCGKVFFFSLSLPLGVGVLAGSSTSDLHLLPFRLQETQPDLC